MSFWDKLFGGGGSNYQPTDTSGLQAGIMSGAAGIEEEERARYQQGLGALTGAFNTAQTALTTPLDANALFSRMSDATGARSKRAVGSLLSSLGARGINPNSGAAQGLMSRLIMSQMGELVGAKRDIGLEQQRVMQQGATQNFQNAFGLANYTNAPVPQALMDARLSLFEGALAREGMQNAFRSQKNANRSGILSGVIGGGASILGGLI